MKFVTGKVTALSTQFTSWIDEIENASQRSSVGLCLSDHTYSSDMAWSSAKLGPQLSFTVSVDNEAEGVGEKILAQAIRNFEDYYGTVSRM